jgi:hypothetical protein
LNIFHEYLNTLKSGGTKNHFRWVKVPGTARYWKAWDILSICTNQTPLILLVKLNFAEMCNGTGIPSILYDCQHVYQRSVASVSYHYKDPIKCVGRVQSWFTLNEFSPFLTSHMTYQTRFIVVMYKNPCCHLNTKTQ